MPIIRTETYVCDICGKELPKDQVVNWLELGSPLGTTVSVWSMSGLFCSFGCLKEMVHRIEHPVEESPIVLKLASWEGISLCNVEEEIASSGGVPPSSQ